MHTAQDCCKCRFTQHRSSFVLWLLFPKYGIKIRRKFLAHLCSSLILLFGLLFLPVSPSICSLFCFFLLLPFPMLYPPPFRVFLSPFLCPVKNGGQVLIYTLNKTFPFILHYTQAAPTRSVFTHAELSVFLLMKAVTIACSRHTHYTYARRDGQAEFVVQQLRCDQRRLIPLHPSRNLIKQILAGFI